MIYDYLIIGGGISGCHTAYKLSKKNPNKSICLFEASNRLGGRLYSVKLESNNVLEAGGARFNSSHKLLMKLIDELGFSKKKIKIGSEVNFYPSKNYTLHTKIHFTKVEDLLKEIIKKANTMPKSSLIKYTTVSFCEKMYGKDVAKYLVDSFPYYGRIFYMNLYDAKRSLNDYIDFSRQFYILSGGLDQIVTESAKRFKLNGGIIKLNTKLLDFSFNKETNLFEVLFSKKNGESSLVHCKNLILTIPQEHLKNLGFIKKTTQLKKLVSSVRPYELMRIYAKYPINKNGKVWFHDLPSKISTNNKIKFIIQINKEQGIIMIAYPNADFTKYWNNIQSLKEMEIALNKNLKQIFPEIKIPKASWIKPYFWSTGGNTWKVNKDSDKISKQIMQPFNYMPLYICGESFSQWQAWVEGALQSSNDLLKII